MSYEQAITNESLRDVPCVLLARTGVVQRRTFLTWQVNLHSRNACVDRTTLSVPVTHRESSKVVQFTFVPDS